MFGYFKSKQDPHIVGIHWAADCVMQWFIILGSIETLFTVLSV